MTFLLRAFVFGRFGIGGFAFVSFDGYELPLYDLHFLILKVGFQSLHLSLFVVVHA